MIKDFDPNDPNANINYEEFVKEFSIEEQNAAAWLSLVLLLAENRAMLDAFRKILIAKEIAGEDEILAAISTELTQPNLGKWYGFMNQLYAYRVAETLDIQRKKDAGELTKENTPEGDLLDVSGGSPIPTGPPNPADVVASTAIIQTEPPTKEDFNEEK
jgi:hypothetical protein